MEVATGKNTILLIDTDISLTNVLSSRLVNVGFNVLVANDSDMALKLFQISTPDLILLDIIVRDNDGKDILSMIKSNPQSEYIPIIILSSDVDVNSKVYGFLSGANDYVVKPFRFAELLARINNQIKMLNMQKELEKKNKELIEKNMLLEKLAITDSLTGLYNRAYVLDRLSTEVLRSSRYKEPISFIIVDIDFFKRINDTFGHLAGDAVLKIVSTHLNNSVRDVDIIGRYGGEEFLVICPNTDLTGARILAERIRINAYSSTFRIMEKDVKISVSAGVSCCVPKLHVNVDAFITKQIGDADIALYKAKSQGRNRIEIFDSLSDTESVTQMIDDDISETLSNEDLLSIDISTRIDQKKFTN